MYGIIIIILRNLTIKKKENKLQAPAAFSDRNPVGMKCNATYTSNILQTDN